MIVITMTAVKAGKTRPLGSLEIVNERTGTRELHNFTARFKGPEGKIVSPDIVVEGFDVRTSPWWLVTKILAAAILRKVVP